MESRTAIRDALALRAWRAPRLQPRRPRSNLVPGMSFEIPPTLGEFAAALKGTRRPDYLARFPEPFLLRQNEPGAPFDRSSTTTAFNTMALTPEKIRSRARAILAIPIYAFRKRLNGNAFGLMITVGRAANNDIVLVDQQVSKFHANFARNVQGQWTITDSSSNGTWVDGRRLETRTAQPLLPGASIDLAHAVLLSFLPAERMFDEIETVWRREGLA